jgi:tryptophan-rich sensory protein
MMDWKTAGRLVASVLACQLAGVLGSIFTIPAIPTWYATLSKPWFSPPNWLFGPAWILLYTLMGVSLFLAWERPKSSERRNGLVWFFLQLALNASWSVVFFGLKNIAGALAVIILLWLLIAATIMAFRRVSRNASLLLIPYLLWVSYAAMLNYGIMTLNP